ncbi:MAG: hypothetical protein K2L45_02605 [Muribaculaceae bacterium]|nr:hypothetical protein [Muribaculaceae bacterium]
MRKFLLALCANFVVFSSMAVLPKQQSNPFPQNFDRSATIRPFGNLRVGSEPSPKKALAKIGYPEDVITSADGIKQEMTVTGSGYFVYWMYLIDYYNESSAGHIVYSDNDEVYLYNIIPYGATDTYIKGVRKGDKIEVSLPQTVKWFDFYDESYGYNLCLLELDPEESSEEDGNWYNVTDATSVSFTIAEDGSITADGLSEDLIIGYAYTDDNSWVGYGVYDLSMTPFNEQAVEVPSDIEVSKNFWSYYCEEEGYGWPVSWAQGFDEIYFQGFSTEMPDAWIKGTVEYEDSNAIISIRPNQYIGICRGFHVYTKAAKSFYDEDYDEEYYEFLPDDYLYQLVWDFEENTIYPKDPDVVLLLNLGKDELYELDEFSDFVLNHQDSFAGIPQNPCNLVFIDFMEHFDEYDLYFNIPGLSTEGDVLITENLGYIIYIDGEEWTFDASDYKLNEDMVEIPWSFHSDYIINHGGTMRQIAFFAEGISSIGVQSVYKYEGEETRSEIVTLNLEDLSAVAGVNGDKKVAEVRYYDVAGREMSNPASGMVIKRVVYEDGSVASFKKVVH